MMTRHFQKREGSPRRRILAASLGCLLLQAHAPAWTFAPSSRPALRLLWEESTRGRRERVACLGGTMTEDSVVVTNIKPIPSDDADSLSASGVLSIQECGPPDWMGTVHTHVRSTDDSLPARRFSPGDRVVMSEWARRWGGQGAFCVLYSERGAHCEVYPPRR